MKERCLFYTDGGEESTAARKALDEYGVLYQVIDLRQFSSSDVQPPRLVSNMGRFEGIERILNYAETFGRKVGSARGR